MKKVYAANSICLTLAAIVILVIFSPLMSGDVARGQGGSGERTPTPAPKKPAKPKTTTVKRAPPARTTSTTNTTARSSVRRSAPQIEMVRIPAGTFTMGSPVSEAGRGSDEGPQHEVSVQSFYMGKYEVSQAEWRAVMGTNPSKFQGDNLPVEQVSWNDAVEFCRKLSQMTDREYRLPSEAEWEYACRAGRKLFSEWVFGLYDMHGNVWEWCEDVAHTSYNGAPTDGSAWLSGGGESRVLRGGSWYFDAYFVRSALRLSFTSDFRHFDLGFRLVAVM